MAAKPSQRNIKEAGFSKLIINLALAAVCLSVTVMILAVGIVKGYQHEVRDKLLGFHSPLRLTRLDLNNSYEPLPVFRNTLMEEQVSKIPGVRAIQPYGLKAGILKTEDAFEGIVLKGAGEKYDWTFIQSHLVSGRLPKTDSMAGHEVLLSQITANRLELTTGEEVFIYFVEDPPRVRRLKVCGIFDTGMGELDERFAFTDLELVQRLNRWGTGQVTGYEVILNRAEDIPRVQENLAAVLPVDLGVQSIFDLYPALFDWLGLLDLNVLVILLLMTAVAAINMITALLILILERTQMIGLLKSMGAEDGLVSKVFLYMAARIVLSGLLLGNLLGTCLALLQRNFGLVRLDPGAYYLNKVPVELHLTDLLWINATGFLVCYLLLLVPSRIVSRVDPVKSIRFDN